MDNTIKIFVDQLKQGKVEKIQCILSSTFLDVEEPELSFAPDVVVQGQAYIAGEELVLRLDLRATAIIPCSICTEPVNVPVQVKNLYQTEPLANIRTGIFDAANIIRESILLETPSFAECCEGHCPQREVVKKYLKTEDTSQEINNEEGYHPFSDLT